MGGLALLALVACKRDTKETSAVASASASPPVAAPSGATSREGELTRVEGGPPFIEDDYERALQRAKAEKKPIFVETWATWCHSCVSMRAYVLPDPKVLAHAGDVVWLALDVDRKENEAILKRLAPPALPTLFRLSENGDVTSRWVGSMTADELARFVSVPDAEKSASAKVIDLYEAKKYDVCVRSVDETLAKKLPPSSDLLGVVTAGTGCSIAAKDKAATKRFADALARLADDFSYPVAADDRSGAYEVLIEALDELKDESTRADEARHWVIFLDEEARRAKTPKERAVFDSHRLLAYTEVNQVAKAIPMLEASERDFPNDFNPPARLARAFLSLGKLDDAEKAADRAVALGYGPRKLRLYDVRAEVAAAKKDKAAEAKALDAALAHAKTITLSANYQKFVDGLSARRARLRT